MTSKKKSPKPQESYHYKKEIIQVRFGRHFLTWLTSTRYLFLRSFKKTRVFSHYKRNFGYHHLAGIDQKNEKKKNKKWKRNFASEAKKLKSNFNVTVYEGDILKSRY